MERKLLTILFVDLVDSTRIVTAADPEVVRRRVAPFFEQVSECIRRHGGLVSHLAGDAMMAAFGIPQTHEDDAVRAARAGLSILESVADLGLEARVGIEAGEVLTDEDDTSFATGEAINVAIRLQQAAAPGQVLIGPGARRLSAGRVDAEDVGPLELKGIDEPVWTWRVNAVADVAPPAKIRAPLIGRDAELDLLANTFARTVQSRRAHLFTIYGDAGVGKSRLAREFAQSLDGATVLAGRCLPYGEGITYWPLAEMVKTAAGIADDDPVKDAFSKLRASCEDEAVADLLALAAGVLDAVESERGQDEIAWATRKWAEQLADTQPLVLAFEDIHWAEEQLLDLIERLASSVREAPLVLLCLARPELFELRPDWGGGRLRATAIELEPLSAAESNELIDALARAAVPDGARGELIEKTGGNPLFLEETVRMLAEGDGAVDGNRIPDTIQALIAARIDRLRSAEKMLLQRAAVIGRTFWEGALGDLAPDVEELESLVEDLLEREFIVRASRSTISGERAYRFKHVLIRDVAYGGLSKTARAQYHARFADWVRRRAGEELLEIRAYHLDRSCTLLAELDGAPPETLAHEAAAALEQAGLRALAREENRAARNLLQRSVELEPTLWRRHKAAVAAWRLDDLPAVAAEMEQVERAAEEAGDSRIRGRALNALAHVALLRDGDLPRARELATSALDVLGDDAPGCSDALSLLAQIAWWRGDLDEHERYAREALRVAQEAGLKDSESEAVQKLAAGYMARLRLDEAEQYVERACQLADESGSIAARAQALRSRGQLLSNRGDLDDADEALAQARALFEQAGAAWPLAHTLNGLADLAERRGDRARAEELLREAIRILKPLEDRGTLCESQRSLAQLLVKLGRVDEAERFALEARRTVGPHDDVSRATTRVALAEVRAAQGRGDEAEQLAREALAIVERTDFVSVQIGILRGFAAHLRDVGRVDDGDELDGQADALVAEASGQLAAESAERAAPIA